MVLFDGEEKCGSRKKASLLNSVPTSIPSPLQKIELPIATAVWQICRGLRWDCQLAFARINIAPSLSENKKRHGADWRHPFGKPKLFWVRSAVFKNTIETQRNLTNKNITHLLRKKTKIFQFYWCFVHHLPEKNGGDLISYIPQLWMSFIRPSIFPPKNLLSRGIVILQNHPTRKTLPVT